MSDKFPSEKFIEQPKEEQERRPKPKAKEGNIKNDSSPDRHNRLESAKSPQKIDIPTKELRQIEEFRRKLEKQKQTAPQQQEKIPVIKNPTETVTIHDEQYTVEYIPKKEIYPAFGYSSENRAVVRQDLSPHVKKFVRAHELYHCYDQATWGGWVGREIRANVVPGLKDPVGLLSTIWATISDLDRIKFYLKRVKESQ